VQGSGRFLGHDPSGGCEQQRDRGSEDEASDVGEDVYDRGTPGREPIGERKHALSLASRSRARIGEIAESLRR